MRNPGLTSTGRALCLSLWIGTAGIAGMPPHAASKDSPSKPQSTAGIPVKNFAAVDLKGKNWNYEHLCGRVTIIHFWATWCAPCRKEIESLRRIDKAYGGKGLQILGINLDSFDRLRLTRFLTVHRIHWPQIHDRRGFDGHAARLFGVESIPAMFLTDCGGTAVRIGDSSMKSAAAKAVDACSQGTHSSVQ